MNELTQTPSLKQEVMALLRKSRLLPAADEVRFWLTTVKNRAKNQAFAASHPGQAFPPSRIAYDAYSFVDYQDYFVGGLQSAEVVMSLIKGEIQAGAKILEWGCGPGRIVRQLTVLLQGSGASLFGCDYNPKSIQWCSAAIPGVTFALNNLKPPLPFAADFFDVLYSSSVFTHLSEEMHYGWIKENARVLKRGGLLIFTTAGDRMAYKLLPHERLRYDAGSLVVRNTGKEGARIYSACQSPAFVAKRLLPSCGNLELVRHDTQLPLAGIQDIWVARKF
jgi:SAM-dependent methyltransferase